MTKMGLEQKTRTNREQIAKIDLNPERTKNEIKVKILFTTPPAHCRIGTSKIKALSHCY